MAWHIILVTKFGDYSLYSIWDIDAHTDKQTWLLKIYTLNSIRKVFSLQGHISLYIDMIHLTEIGWITHTAVRSHIWLYFCCLSCIKQHLMAIALWLWKQRKEKRTSKTKAKPHLRRNAQKTEAATVLAQIKSCVCQPGVYLAAATAPGRSPDCGSHGGEKEKERGKE